MSRLYGKALSIRDEINEIIQQTAKETAAKITLQIRGEHIPDLMTMDQSCAYLQINKLALTKQVNNGLPVTYKLGEPRYFKSEINAWLKGTDSDLKVGDSMKNNLKIKGSDIPGEYGMSHSTLWRLRKDGILK